MSNTQALKYAAMQKNWYDSSRTLPEEIVGSYGYHENFPYETFLLHTNGDIRKPLFETTKDKRAFDIACGEGRMIRRMERFFGSVDGADISEKMVETARERCPNSTIYLTNGMNCGDAKTGYYDFVFCTISMQHICVHETRTSIMRDIVRILKPGGCVTLQMIFSKYFPYVYVGQAAGKFAGQDAFVRHYAKTGTHAEWLENRYDATTTNGYCDAMFGEKDIDLVKSDMKTLFEECEMWFFDISIGRGGNPRALPLIHPNAHLEESYAATHFAFINCSGPKKNI